MIEKQILLTKASDVKEFINITQCQIFPVYLRSGRYVVDAKSILGVFSLDLSRPVVLEYDPEGSPKTIAVFEGAIKKFEVIND